MNKKEVIYIVGHNGPEHNYVESVHKSYEGALRDWDKIRKELLEHAKDMKDGSESSEEMYERIIQNLSCKDPKRIDNYPHETPYIYEEELKP